jgi:hypothetical protein
MIEVEAGKLTSALGAITSFCQLLKEAWADNRGITILPSDHSMFVKHARYLEEVAAQLDLGGQKHAAHDLAEHFNQVPFSDGTYHFGAPEFARLINRSEFLAAGFYNALQAETCLFLSRSDLAYYKSDEPLFGSDVLNKFGSAVNDDIEEAGKCLALGRGTATVFHLMRVLESAVQTIAIKIGATIHDGQGKGLPWGIIADNMKPIIDRMPKGSHDQIKWYRVQYDLVVVNRAWRAPTNHPKEVYTPEQAREVFAATKAFMNELALLV